MKVAEMNMVDPLLTPREFAKFLRLTPRALEIWRREGRGPKYCRLSGHRNVRYPASEVRKWLAQLERW